ncbi:M3 family metallopeptidase [Auraticoccus monumenti]|uniref:Peptidyl-dipeptidase Dcp n=1 Tax=Auraticoccus monumenti TaxID=675864 RepID=A0A1G7C0L4_9ACTN|nr:M3 family metallopeptidase [Auraticoccus monumenti]SDE31975.1 peptidyl-dipeptidase Dcp [Auraticoccus monumenti]
MPDPENPLLAASPLPFGLPPFAGLSLEHHREAVEQGMVEQAAEVEAVAASTEPPTVENTLVALERSGELLQRATAVFFHLVGSDGDEALRALAEELSPRLSEHEDSITLDRRLFARVDALHEQLDALGLDEETAELVRATHRDMVQAGAALDDAAQQRLREINAAEARLTSRFQKELLADTRARAVVVEDVAELDGLDPAAVDAAAEAAAARGLDGRWLLTCTNFTNHPALGRLHPRETRRRLFDAQVARGGDGEHDTAPLVLELVALRAERARLLGFPDHASVVTAVATAGSPAAVRARLDPMAATAARKVGEERAALQEEVERHCAETGQPLFELAAWDWAYYTERLRRRRYDLDLAALRPWFEAGRVLREGVFRAAELVYGLTFAERPDLHGHREEVEVFEVRDADGTPLGLYLLDLHRRDTKNGGAWANSLVSQSRLLGTPTVVSNNLNVVAPAPGQPTLLSLDEVTTLFHEFGHALHALLSDVTYPRFSGTRVPRDFVEFPSQVNEMWVLDPRVLPHYARHVETGEPLPDGVVERLSAAETFNQGFATAENLASALLDQEWHGLAAGEQVASVPEFQAAALARIGLDDPVVPPRYSTRYFAHAFAGGYDARYYSYLWSEVLDADTVAWFTEQGGAAPGADPVELRAGGDHFRAELLSRGSSRDPMSSYRAFRGRDPEEGPLLARRGLLPATPTDEPGSAPD